MRKQNIYFKPQLLLLPITTVSDFIEAIIKKAYPPLDAPFIKSKKLSLSIGIRNPLPKIKRNTIEDSKIKDVRNHFKIKKENKGIKDIVIRYIRTLFESEKKDY